MARLNSEQPVLRHTDFRKGVRHFPTRVNSFEYFVRVTLK